VVAGGAGDGPARGQRLGAGENFFRDDVERPPEGRGGLDGRELFAQRRLQLLPRLRAAGLRALEDARILEEAEIAHRVGEAVGMIDAQPADLSLGEQLQGQPVRLVEYRWIL